MTNDVMNSPSVTQDNSKSKLTCTAEKCGMMQPAPGNTFLAQALPAPVS